MSICSRSDSWYILPEDSSETMFLYAPQQWLFVDASTLVESCSDRQDSAKSHFHVKNIIFAAKTDNNYHADLNYVDVYKNDLNNSKIIQQKPIKSTDNSDNSLVSSLRE